MEEFDVFFEGKFKVTEVGGVSTTTNHKELRLCKCPYDGLALNQQDTQIYLKYIDVKEPEEKFILLQQETIIIDNEGLAWQTNDTGLKTISNGNIEEEVKRKKEILIQFGVK